MSGFAADAVDVLDFDFTQIPRDDGNGFVGGKGVVAEPSKDRITAFYEAFFAIRRLATDITAVPTGDEILDLAQIVANVCNGTPTYDEIALLPPRYLGAFVRWLLKELTDPKG